MDLDYAWVVVNKQTGNLYDEEVYLYKHRVERSIQQGAYYEALHSPVIMTLKEAMEWWIARYKHEHQLTRFPYVTESFDGMKVSEAIAICKFLGFWQMEATPDRKQKSK